MGEGKGKGKGKVRLLGTSQSVQFFNQQNILNITSFIPFANISSII